MALFSGSALRRLGMWAYDQSQAAADEGQGIVDNARTDALASLDKGREAIGAGRDAGLLALGRGYSQARDDLNTNLSGAIARFDPYVKVGRQALDGYSDSIGLNGQEGRDRAYAGYEASPEYRVRTEQGTDAAMRAASAAGALGSGNTLSAVAKIVQDEAAKDYGRHQDRLLGLSDRGQQAVGSQAQLQTQLGTNLAGLSQGEGRDTASLQADAAGREASLFGQEAGMHGQLAGLRLNNLWNGTQMGTGAVMNAGQQATGKVMSGVNFGLNAGGSLLRLIGLGGR